MSEKPKLFYTSERLASCFVKHAVADLFLNLNTCFLHLNITKLHRCFVAKLKQSNIT